MGRKFFATDDTGSFHQAFLQDLLLAENLLLNKINKGKPEDNRSEDNDIVPNRNEMKGMQEFKQVFEKVVGDQIQNELD